jgi:iron(III) transport system substrate-binding protein
MNAIATYLVVACALALNGAEAEEAVLNIYSARHYASDEAIYRNFTQQTGIQINRIEGKANELLERIRHEGANSPADVFLTVDAASLAVSDAQGILAPVNSAVLASRVPAYLRGATWFGVTTRARLLVYNKRLVKPESIPDYESLADPALKGRYCSIPGGHIYNLLFVASMVAHLGEEPATRWAQGLVNNMARSPRGGDTDQIKAVATGECGVAVSNSYYLARLMASDRVEERNLVKRLGIVWPNQDGRECISTCPGPGSSRLPRIGQPPFVSWNIWSVTTHNVTLLRPTTNGPW